MSNILETIFEGRYTPLEDMQNRPGDDHAAYKAARSQCVEKRQAFEKTLSDSQRAQLTELSDAQSLMQYYELRQLFVEGARFGAQCAVCMLSPTL